MGQVNFAYVDRETGSLQLSMTILADRAWLRDELRADVLAAGLDVRDCIDLSTFSDRPAQPLGDVVLVDCPLLGGAELAALSRLDVRAKRAGARLVVSTSIAALEDVFACCDQSAPQILVDPSRADRITALGRVLAEFPSLRVRDLSEEDRLNLLRLTEQVGRIAERLEAGGNSVHEEAEIFRFESPGQACHGLASARVPVTAAPVPLPEPALVRRIIRQRQSRARFFDAELFADPAWDILLDLTAARAEQRRISVTSLCTASGVPPTTALRWIGQMTDAGLLERVQDDTDRRRAFVALTHSAADAMARYFAQLGPNAISTV